MKTELPTLAITMGDPAGIGPEVVAKALGRDATWQACRPVVIGDWAVMARAAALVGSALAVRRVDSPEDGGTGREIRVMPAGGETLEGLPWGRLDPRAARAQVAYVRRAVDLAMAGSVAAMVTGPVHKKGLRLAGVPHPGHTEMLADWTGATEVAMMLAGVHLRVVPVTLHVSLRDAVGTITTEAICRSLRLTHGALGAWFGLPRPRLAVSGLNPHAGDGGLFGSEEETIIAPAVQAARDSGLNVEGPLPPDAVFLMAADGRFDAVVAMYHDQALIPLKLLDRDNAVNVTLGLPIIRTSVDHGTAYDIAGAGMASEGSMAAAITLAARLARIRWGVGGSACSDQGGAVHAARGRLATPDPGPPPPPRR
jgi:4-hydroxythreonine-4-phosphate dehydrogenase